MTIADRLAEIDRLRALPFPAERGRSGGAYGGPGFHMADLLVSQDFREDDGAELIEAEEQFDAEREALVLLLSGRWGEPEEWDLTGHLIRFVEGEPVPEPLATLCEYVGRVHAWRVGDRWISIGLGQQGRESPIQLVAAVGEAATVGEWLRPDGE